MFGEVTNWLLGRLGKKGVPIVTEVIEGIQAEEEIRSLEVGKSCDIPDVTFNYAGNEYREHTTVTRLS